MTAAEPMLIPYIDGSQIQVGPLDLAAHIDLCDDLVHGFGNHIESPLDVTDRIDGFQLGSGGQGQQPLDGLDGLFGSLCRFVAFRSRDQKVDKLSAIAHPLGDGDALQRGDVVGVSHFESPHVARALTRYVAGTLLASLRQLQRKACVRRIAGSRPSDVTVGDVR